MPSGALFSSNREEPQRGLSLVEVVLVLLVVAIASAGLYTYLARTARTLETVSAGRVLGHARLTADLATLAGIRNQLDLYHATHGQWPSSKEASAAILKPPPRFQCAGNDYTFDPASGTIGLVIMDPSRC